MIQKNKKTMIKEKGKEICQRVLDTNWGVIFVEKVDCEDIIYFGLF